jgi:hypothetical protein
MVQLGKPAVGRLRATRIASADQRCATKPFTATR